MKPIENFPNYTINEYGSVQNVRTGRLLKNCHNTKGYLQVMATDINGKQRNISIHRTVYKTYVGELLENMDINHIDGNKENNHFSNLEQITRSQNVQHAVKTGLIKSGEECKLSKQINKIHVITGDIICKYGSITLAAKDVNGFGSMISRCCSGHRRTAYGFKWQYA